MLAKVDVLVICSCFGRTYTKIGTIHVITLNSEAFHIFLMRCSLVASMLAYEMFVS